MKGSIVIKRTDLLQFIEYYKEQLPYEKNKIEMKKLANWVELMETILVYNANFSINEDGCIPKDWLDHDLSMQHLFEIEGYPLLHFLDKNIT